MKTIIHEHAAAVSAAAAAMLEFTAEKPQANIGIVLNSDCLEVLRCAFGTGSRQTFANCRFFLLNELCPPYEKGISSLRSVFEGLFPFAAGQCAGINTENPALLDESIAAAGGLDLVLAGIGSNSSLAMNEASTPYASLSHKQKLTAASRRDAAGIFGVGAESVPEMAVTAGIGTITRAGCIIAAAFGSSKAGAVFKMLYARTDSAVPSAFLQLPARVTVYLDSEAAAEL